MASVISRALLVHAHHDDQAYSLPSIEHHISARLKELASFSRIRCVVHASINLNFGFWKRFSDCVAIKFLRTFSCFIEIIEDLS